MAQAESSSDAGGTSPAQNNSSHPENPTPKKGGAAWQLRLILAITVLPVVAAYGLYFSGIQAPQDQSINKGVLLSPPLAVSDLLADAEGDLPSFERNAKWRLLIPVTADCLEDCQANLYTTRQVHKRLGRESERVERYAVNIGGPAGAAYLASIREEHPTLRSFSVNEADWRAWLAHSNAPADVHSEPFYLLVDQLGHAMMFYTADHHGNLLLKDVKRVLRFSPNP